MSLDLILVAVLAVFAGLGAWRGSLATGGGLIALVLAYLAAATAGSSLGEGVAYQLAVSSLLGALLASSLAFFSTFIVCSILISLMRRHFDAERGGGGRSAVDRLGGLCFGLVRGGCIALLLAWMATWLDLAREQGVEGFEAAPPTADSRAVSVASTVIESAVQAAFSDAGPAAKMAARLAARPGEAIEAIQTLLEDPRVRSVQGDEFFWTLVSNGASERALNRGSFYGIAHDGELRQRFADLGLVSEAAASDTKVFRDEVRAVLDEVGPRIKGLKDDPELQALAHDPEIMAMLESGNTLALIQHPGIRRVAARISSGAGS